MNLPTYTIGVTGLNAIDSPGPGVSVIRGLRESSHFNVRIIGLSYEALEPGIYMRDVVDKTYQIPFPSAGHEALLHRLQYVHKQEKLDLIIPNFDAELFGFIKFSHKLAAMGIRTFLPTMNQFQARLKSNLNIFGLRLGINVPKSQSITSVEDMRVALNGFKYPVVIKGKFYDAKIAYNFEQAQAYYYKISAQWGIPLILQQFIEGDEYNLTGLGDGKGNLIGAVPMRKMYITDKGKAWAGITIQDQALINMAKTFCAGTKWSGGFELEVIKDKTGRMHLIEINPRFPAWVYLSVGAGQNHPEALVRLALGETLEPYVDYEVGKLFIRYSYDMICDLKDFQQISALGEL